MASTESTLSSVYIGIPPSTINSAEKMLSDDEVTSLSAITERIPFSFYRTAVVRPVLSNRARCIFDQQFHFHWTQILNAHTQDLYVMTPGSRYYCPHKLLINFSHYYTVQRHGPRTVYLNRETTCTLNVPMYTDCNMCHYVRVKWTFVYLPGTSHEQPPKPSLQWHWESKQAPF